MQKELYVSKNTDDKTGGKDRGSSSPLMSDEEGIRNDLRERLGSGNLGSQSNHTENGGRATELINPPSSAGGEIQIDGQNDNQKPITFGINDDDD